MARKLAKGPNRKKLREKAWKLQSEFIRRTEPECFTCGSRNPWKEDNAGHFEHKDALDFVTLNIHRQCVRCNKWLHGNLGVYAINLDKKYGSGTAELIHKQRNRVRKHTIDELEDLVDTYTRALEALNAKSDKQ